MNTPPKNDTAHSAVRERIRLSFVIPAHNEERYIGKCLASVLAETKGVPGIEIVVVDNASTDTTQAIAKTYEGVAVVYEPVKGLPRTRQTGYEHSHGALIANIDADTMLPRGWLKTVLGEFERDPELLALSGPHIYYDLPRLSRTLVKVFYYITYISYAVNRFIIKNGSMLQGGNFIIRRDALEKIGGYDTNILFYGEDIDIARRLSAVGKVKFTLGLPIYASGRRVASEGVLKTATRYTLNYFWVLFLKHPYDTAAEVSYRQEQIGGQVAATEGARKQELLAAIVSLIVVLAILGGIGYLIYFLVRLR